jgi:WD40 repeat protein
MAHSQARLRKERDATVQQKVKSLIREGESYLANDRIAEAKQKVFEARELARGRGWSTLSADLALLEIYRRSPPELMVLQAHEGPVRCLAVSVEGRDVYSGGADGMLRWWSMPAGRLAGVWPAHPGGVTALARSRDGRFLVSGGAGGAMRVWDLRKPGGSRTLTSHSNTIASLVFSPQGEVLASADSDGWVHLWHGHTYEHLRAVQTTERELRGVVFGTNTLQVASAYGFGVRFWDLATGQGGNRVLSAGGCLAFVSSPDGSVVFLSNAAGVISQRDLLGREIAGTQIQLNVPCPGLAVSGSLGRVAVGGADGSLRVWDHTTRPMERVVALYGHQGAVNGVAFLEAAEVLVSAGDDGTVRFWKIRPEQALIFQARPNSEMHRARFLSGDLMVLAGNEGGYANLWDAVTGKLLQVFVGHEGWVYDVVGTPDARTVYSGGMDGTIRAWQTTTGREVWRRGPELAGGLVNVRPVRGLALSPDAECLVAGLDSLTNPGSGSDAGVLVALASETGSVLTNFVAHERGILAVAFSPDQRKVATVGRDGWLKLWNRADWRLLGTLPGMAIDANQIVFSTDGHRGYSVAASGAPLAWDTESHRLIGSFTRSPARCVSVALSADNALLLGGTASGELTLWDPVTRAELRTFQLGPSARTVHALGFAERTRRVAAGGRLLQLWDFDQGSSLSAAQEPAAADRVKSAADPASGRTMLRLAGWYALRGSWDWATDLYQQAREQGALVRDLDLARCLWQQGQLDSAVAQLESAAGQAPEVYLELCRNAIQGEIASQQPPDYELPVPAGAIVAPSRPEVWKDIWTTSVLAYSDVTETPGGGKADEILRVGGSRDDYESLLQMEVAGLPERAASAQLYLFCREVVGYSNAMYLERITADWDWRIRGTGPDLKRLWYQDKPPSEPWGEQPLPGPLPGRWYPIDITRLYNAWKSGQLPNHGVLLRPTFTKNETFNLFYSSRHRHDPGLWPRLVIVPATE